MEQTSSEPIRLTIAIDGDGNRMTLEGALDIRTLTEAERALREWRTKRKSRVVDLSKVSDLVRAPKEKTAPEGKSAPGHR